MDISPLSEGFILIGNKNKHRYQIKKYLGRGGFGITYLAQEEVTQDGIPQTHTFTIKEFCLSDSCIRDADGTISVPKGKRDDFNEAKKEFRSEADLLHNLSHEGIVPVSEVFEQNNTVYYVMQYLGDTSLSTLIAKNGGRMEESAAIDIMRKIACSLLYLHQHRMTHLDVKPNNIMIKKDGEPVLIDFGLARSYGKDGHQISKVVAAGTSKGYSPVEQYEPDGLSTFTPQADIYALGATLFHMLTGKAPVESKEVSAKYIIAQLPDGISDNTSNALIMAMQKRKEDRPANMEAFLQILGATDEPDNTPDGNETERIGGEQRREQHSWTEKIDKKYVITALAAIAVVALLFFYNRKPEPKTDEVKTDTLIVVPDTTPTPVPVPTPDTPSVHHPVVVPEPQPQPTPTPSLTPEPEAVQVSTTKDLGYAVWHGTLRKGKPDGEGKMVFKKAHVIDSYDPDKSEAESGDYVIGIYEDGHLVSGKWYDASGNKKKSIYIGGQ